MKTEQRRNAEHQLIVALIQAGLLPKHMTPDQADDLYPKITQIAEGMRPAFREWEEADGYRRVAVEALRDSGT